MTIAFAKFELICGVHWKRASDWGIDIVGNLCFDVFHIIIIGNKRGFRINVLVPGGVWTEGKRNVTKEVLAIKPNLLNVGLNMD